MCNLLDLKAFGVHLLLSTAELTRLASVDCLEGAGSDVRRVRRFNQVTGIRVRKDGQQVAVPRLLHHLLHLENRKFKTLSHICDMAWI